MLRSRSLLLVAAGALAALSLAACDSAGTAPDAADESPASERAMEPDVLRATLLSDRPLADVLADLGGAFAGRGLGIVYTQTDAAGPNDVLTFVRGLDGTLTAAGTHATNGTGSGGMLGAATDPLAMSPDGRSLYVLNRGSDDISVFAIRPTGLELQQVLPSGGAAPISITVGARLVYVLHTGRSGAPGSVVAFRRTPGGRLAPIAGGAAVLPAGIGGPTQVRFAPSGRTAVITDRPSNQILTYPVEADGTPGVPVLHPSAGVTPFGFDFDRRDRLFVSDANAPAGPVPDGSSVSAYRLAGTRLSVLDPAVPTTETAACWVRILGPFLYATNTASNTISGFEIQPDGTLALLDADGVTATTGGNPRDMAITLRYLYAQTDGSLDAYRIHADGSLTPIGSTSVPATARGVVAL